LGTISVVPPAAFKIAEKLLEKSWERSQRLDEEMSRKRAPIFVIIWNTQSLEIRNKIESMQDYHAKQQDHDFIWLFKAIKSVCLTEREGVPAVDSIRIIKEFINSTQKIGESNSEFYKRFYIIYETYLEMCTLHKIQKWTDAHITAIFIDNQNQSNQNFVKNALNMATSKVKTYPITLTEAYKLLSDYKIIDSKSGNNNSSQNSSNN
jgi:hypothetical protein